MLRVLFLLASIGPALAQPGPAPELQAAQNKLLQEISNNLQCSTQLIILQQQVAKLEAELKELKEKDNAK